MKKNVASQVIGAQMVATDGTAFTGSVTVYVTGDGGTQALGSVGSGACTHEGNGFHTYNPAQAETNYDHIGFTFIGTGAVPVTVQVYTTFPQTGDSYAQIGTAGAGLTAVPWNAAWDAEVQSECTDALNAYDPPTNTEMTAAFTEIKGATWSSATDTLEALRDRGDSAWITAVGFSTHSAADVWTSGTRTLTANTNLNDPTAAAIADAVWDEAIAGHAGAGSTGEALSNASSAGDPWTTSLPGSYTGTQAGKILADILVDTAEIGAAGAGLTEAGGTGDHLSAVPWNVSWDAEVQSECADALNAYDPPTNAELTSAISGLNDISVSDILTTQMTESYAALGAAPTLAQSLFLIQQHLSDSGIIGTTKTVRKVDGATTAATFTLDDAATPTDITRDS